MVCFMGKKKRTFQSASFITNDFVSMTVHARLLCHPKGLSRAGTVSFLSAVTSKAEGRALLLLYRSSHELWETEAP